MQVDQKNKKVTILYNVNLPREITDASSLSREEAKKILVKYPNLDLSETSIIEDLNEMITALDSYEYETRAVNIYDDFNFLIEELTDRRPDVIFNLCESMNAISKHEAYVAGLYELLRIPYTGAPPEALSIAVRKARTKMLLQSNNVPTPGFSVFTSPDGVHLNGSFGFPCIVKPAEEDGSIGIEPAAIVSSEQLLKDRVRFITEKYKQPALVEDYIDGRELNVAILGNNLPEVLPISEIDFSTLPDVLPKIVSYAAKWIEDSDYYRGTKGKCPAELPFDIENKIKSIALTAYELIGCRDYARIDFRLTKDFTPYVLEVNPNPDLSSDAGFMRSAKASGRTFEKTLAQIVGFALVRAGIN